MTPDQAPQTFEEWWATHYRAGDQEQLEWKKPWAHQAWDAAIASQQAIRLDNLTPTVTEIPAAEVALRAQLAEAKAEIERWRDKWDAEVPALWRKQTRYEAVVEAAREAVANMWSNMYPASVERLRVALAALPKEER